MKLVKGFENNYEIDQDGNVFNLKTGRQKMPTLLPVGYYSLNLYINNVGHWRYIHRMVAEAYLENPDNKPEVNHIDGVKTNNTVSNLEWVTRQENSLHAYKLGLSYQEKNLNQAQLMRILIDFLGGKTLTELAVEYKTGISRLSINIRNFAKITNLEDAYEQMIYNQKVNRNIVTATAKRRMVDQFNSDGVFLATHASLTAAARALGKDSSGTISNALNPSKDQSMAYGYIWRYSN